jgi:hypothetical protein
MPLQFAFLGFGGIEAMFGSRTIGTTSGASPSKGGAPAAARASPGGTSHGLVDDRGS